MRSSRGRLTHVRGRTGRGPGRTRVARIVDNDGNAVRSLAEPPSPGQNRFACGVRRFPRESHDAIDHAARCRKDRAVRRDPGLDPVLGGRIVVADAFPRKAEGADPRLAPQPARVLSCLLRSRGELVTRETLRDELWGDEVIVDFDGSLNSCVKQIRFALDDAAVTPRYVETLPRRGYRFIAQVTSSVDDAPFRPQAIASGRGRRAVSLLAVVATLALSAVATGIVLRGSNPTVSESLASASSERGSDDYLMARYVMGRGHEGDLAKAHSQLGLRQSGASSGTGRPPPTG